MDFLNDLNPEQMEAVFHTEGPVLVLAGAGSGKTRVLTYKVAHIISKGLARPGEILAVTFTNKAAAQMKERIANILADLSFPYMGTFHSFCTRLLRLNLDGEAAVTRNFVIYDEADRKIVIKECVKELGIEELSWPPGKIIHRIGGLKNRLTGPDDYSREACDYDSRVLCEIYSLYQKKLTSFNAMDFDDLLMQTVLMLKRDPEILGKYTSQFKYILVDEYQDINSAQYDLLQMLSSVNRNITAVGDDDQSIYRFRGAELGILLRFESDFPDAKLVKLEQNYRSTKLILEAANHLMKHNEMRKQKNLWTTREEGDLIGYYRAPDGRSEARFVALKIRELMKKRMFTYRDFAVFYRTNAQSRLFEEVFIQEGIPYNLVGSLRFYERKEIKDLLAYLRIIVNPSDNISLVRVINVPSRKIGKTTISKIASIAGEKHVSLFEGCKLFVSHMASKAGQHVAEFVEIVERGAAMLQSAGALDILRMVIESTGYRDYLLEGGTAEGVAREENVGELLNVVQEFEKISGESTLPMFLSHITLLSDIDLWDEDQGKVNLMTFHLTKGLEFPVAFITGLEERFLPHALSMLNQEDLEEERRLCYVGITRARDVLFISHADTRYTRGEPEVRIKSRFLMEIPGHLLSRIDSERGALPSRLIPLEPDRRVLQRFSMSDRVRSKVFGSGTVKHVDGDVVTVEFEDGRMRKVVSDYIEPELVEEKPFHRGDRVRHSDWGSGIICSLYPEQNEVLVSFAGIGTKRVGVPELRLMSSNVTGRAGE